MNVATVTTNMGKTIHVSDHVYDRLDEIKDEGDHTTFDSTLREVLRDAGYNV